MSSEGIVFFAGAAAAACLALASVDALLAMLGPLSSSSRNVVSSGGRSIEIEADPSTLVRTPLFGEEVSEEEPVFDTEALPATTLRLKLIGPAASVSGDAQASALIALPDGRQTRIRVDEEIIPGVVLKQVKRTQVIISRNGNPETLSLARPLTAQELRARTIGAATENDGDASADEIEPAVAEDAPERTAPQAPITIAELTGEVPALAPLLQSQGFQGDDRIIAIDGEAPPTDEATLREAFASWITMPSLTITVQRGGSIINQTVELSEISTL
ncbi:MAG: type II secretion system protein N [Pseudomonadota bacterium]